ncbi:MAG: hypothetical protein BGO29_12270 [Bacteroidales bacterium 36-12]|nr:MAG: hypothetical protein BGO29_12270 [Bacteroidales bacterium 36-12]
MAKKLNIMKTRRTILFFIFCLIIFFCQAQIKDKISLDINELMSVKIYDFDKISWKSSYHTTTEEGKPELPYYRVSYVLPLDAVVSGIKFNILKKQKLWEDIYIYPCQAPILSNQPYPTKFTVPNEKVYMSNTAYPDKLYEIESDDIFQGYHIVTFRIYPLEYIPKGKILNYYPQLEYTVEYEYKKDV